MSRNAGMTSRVGKHANKSKMNWIEYDINWFSMAKTSCKKCYGRGFQGYEPQSDQDKEMNKEREYILCDCVADRWSKMTDEERMTFASRKENADEIVAHAKEQIRKVIEEEKDKLKEKEAVE
jgi:hypothetical protein